MQEELHEEITGPLTTYRQYLHHGGYEIEMSAIRIADERIRAEIGSEWSVTAICHERPELTFEMNQTDLAGLDDPRLVFGRVEDLVRSYLDTNLRTADSVPDV